MKKKTKLPNVSVTTLPNGYALTFDGMRQPKGYMYFTLEDLLKGFMIHIGCGKTDQLDMSDIDDFLDAVLAYLVKVNLVARWTLLDAKGGQKMLDRLMAELDGKQYIEI